MYISELKLWNFRKYGGDDFDLAKPHLVVPFKKGMNVLIGENDSGKTAIIDAIKYVLKTNAYESIRIQQDDFYNDKERLRIEILIDGMTVDEASCFTNITIPPQGGLDGLASMKLILDVTRKDGHILPYEVKGGNAADGHSLEPLMKENLRVTYLKPLRDAENELTAKKNSRLSQILQSHELLKQPSDGSEHELIAIIKKANEEIENWFDDDTGGDASHKKQIKGVIDDFLKMFISEDAESQFLLSDPTIKNILERLAIGVVDSKNLGLGTLNRLFMATELLHLRKKGNNLKVCLIEELEAHIHPQAQMKVITALQDERNVQFILTTHSPNITSKVKLGADEDVNNIIICNGKNVFPMGKDYTQLNKKDYKYLDTFLDVTKSNLFFAKGVILVEGWAEEILLPVIAEKMGIDLTQKEISVVNVGSTAYLHFARIFMRRNEPNMNVKCAIVTDLDVKPDDPEKKQKEETKRTNVNRSLGELPDNVKLFLAKEWTLEWCLFKSPVLSEIFKDSVAAVHCRTNEFKKEGNPAQYKPEFETKLKGMLAKTNSKLDKTAVALNLTERIKTQSLDFTQNDDYIKYLLDAIRFVTH
jgi:putative ATP-dependent endonuclease of OLD family